MKKDPGLVFRLCLVVGDALAIVLALAFAYITRTQFDSRPYYFESNLSSFVLTALLLLPLWILILAALGTYHKNLFIGKSRGAEVGKLALASVLGVMTMITFDFFANADLFPVRVVAALAVVFCFVMLLLIRFLLNWVRRLLVRRDFGVQKVLVIGNNLNTEHLISYMTSFPEYGFEVVGAIASKKYIPSNTKIPKFDSLKAALAQVQPSIIFQTDEQQTNYIYREALERHISYYLVPSEPTLAAHMGELELVGNTPAILVRPTPLMGNARIIKRAMDLLFGGIATLVAAIPMAVIWLVIKLSDPKSPAVFKSVRLSRYNQEVTIYKFRTMKSEYSGMSPEAAFTKMGKPELIKEYRENGDMIADDPRITRIGKFLRKTSLDELPQLINVLKGDISLVGPRALVPGELRDYGDRSLLLSVKSGLTGLAQVSGRRDISFDERRTLDLYYIQNWSPKMDIAILFRTVLAVLKREGAS